MNGKKTAELTTFQKNKRDAVDQVAKMVEKYGLKVDRSGTGGCYRDECMEFFNLHVTTEKLPVKGNKKLIRRLEADHFWVQKWLETLPGTPRQYMFRVCKTVTIATGRAEEIGWDLIELERKLYDGAAVCASNMTERQKEHILRHFAGLLKVTRHEGLEFVAVNKEVVV